MTNIIHDCLNPYILPTTSPTTTLGDKFLQESGKVQAGVVAKLFHKFLFIVLDDIEMERKSRKSPFIPSAFLWSKNVYFLKLLSFAYWGMYLRLANCAELRYVDVTDMSEYSLLSPLMTGATAKLLYGDCPAQIKSIARDGKEKYHMLQYDTSPSNIRSENSSDLNRIKLFKLTKIPKIRVSQLEYLEVKEYVAEMDSSHITSGDLGTFIPTLLKLLTTVYGESLPYTVERALRADVAEL